LINDPKYVTMDLEFDTADQAEALLAAMRVIWSRMQGTVVMGPSARILEMAESKEY
jgi:hypothetical protein